MKEAPKTICLSRERFEPKRLLSTWSEAGLGETHCENIEYVRKDVVDAEKADMLEALKALAVIAGHTRHDETCALLAAYPPEDGCDCSIAVARQDALKAIAKAEGADDG